jgi:hypothetical protein
MLIPPSILWIRARRVPIVLPVILIWPIAVVLWLALLPMLAVVAATRCGRSDGDGRAGQEPRLSSRALLLGGPLLFNVFCRLRGLSVQVRRTEQLTVDIRAF